MAAVVALEEEGGGMKQQGGRGEQHQCQEINEVAEETEVPVCWTASESHLRQRVAASASRSIHSFLFIAELQRCPVQNLPQTGFFLLNYPKKINKINPKKVL